MKKISVAVLSFALMLTTLSSARAGVLMVNQEKDPSGTMKTSIYIDQGKLRLETQGKEGQEVAIFRKDKQAMWILDPTRKKYSEVGKNDLAQMKTQMDESLKMMEAQMKNLPPEQQKVMREMMGSMKAPLEGNIPKITYKKTATGQKVKSWTCDSYQGFMDGQKRYEVCSADWQSLGLSPQDFQVMQDFGSFFEAFSKDLGKLMKVGSADWEKDQGYPGVPVKTVDYSATGVAENSMELTDLKKENFDPALFEIPAGYQKQTLGT